MGIGSMWHWLIVLAVVLLLFGGGKISGLMGDFAKGIKAFKKGLKEDEASEDETSTAKRTIEGEATPKQKDSEKVAEIELRPKSGRAAQTDGLH